MSSSTPTETLYGLGGRVTDTESAHRIAALKDRPSQGLIVLVNGIPPNLPPLQADLAHALWPGPVTLIVPERIADRLHAPPAVRGASGTLAIRWSPDPVATALVHAVGPITSTSANRHGEPPMTHPDSCSLAVDSIVDSGPLEGGRASTLVALDGRILREGVDAAAVRQILAVHGYGA